MVEEQGSTPQRLFTPSRTAPINVEHDEDQDELATPSATPMPTDSLEEALDTVHVRVPNLNLRAQYNKARAIYADHGY